MTTSQTNVTRSSCEVDVYLLNPDVDGDWS